MRRRKSFQHARAALLFTCAVTLPLAVACSRGGEVQVGDTTAAVNVAATPRPAADSAPVVTVYKSPTCTCCTKWVDHMKRNGFKVDVVNARSLDAIKRRYGVAPEHAACHTAIVGDYVVEGHIPAEDIRRLLAQRPAITGLAVPGMPIGSPGMEGAYKQSYEVLAFTRDGASSVFARH